jgi:hypothetical protein
MKQEEGKMDPAPTITAPQVALPTAHTGVPFVKIISMLSVVKIQTTFTMCCAPTANHPLH